MAKTVFCTQCGKEIPEEAKFCLSCGAPQKIVPKSEHPPEPEITQLPPPPPPPTSTQSSSPPAQKKPVLWGIIGALVIVFLVIIGIFLALSGFSPGVSPTGAITTPTPMPEPPMSSLEPDPTQTVPPGTEVQVQVNKNNSNGAITFLFSGGPGQKVVRSIDITVTREDGNISSGTLRPVALDELVLQGTRGGTDRVVVRVTYFSGNVYTIIDRQIGIRD